MCAVLRGLAAVLLLSTFASGAFAQSVCVGPFLGDGGVEEVCVNATVTGVGGAVMNFRGPNPLTIPPTVVGEYTIAFTATYASDGGGMAMVLDGTATRTSAGGCP